jgi:hypothetical protein
VRSGRFSLATLTSKGSSTMATIENLNVSITELDEATSITLIKRIRAERRVLPVRLTRKSPAKKPPKNKTTKKKQKQLSLEQLYAQMTPEQKKALENKLLGRDK